MVFVGQHFPIFMVMVWYVRHWASLEEVIHVEEESVLILIIIFLLYIHLKYSMLLVYLFHSFAYTFIFMGWM